MSTETKPSNGNQLAVIADKIVPKPTKRQILEAAAVELFKEHEAKRAAAEKHREGLKKIWLSAVVKAARKLLKTGEPRCDEWCGNKFNFDVTWKIEVPRNDELTALEKAWRDAPAFRNKTAQDFYKELVVASGSPVSDITDPKIKAELLTLGKKLLGRADAAKPAINI